MKQQTGIEPTWREVLQYPGIPLAAGAALMCGALAPGLAEFPVALPYTMLLMGGLFAGYGLTVTPPKSDDSDAMLGQRDRSGELAAER